MSNVERITFQGFSGQKISAKMNHPSIPPVAYAIFAHCFACSKDLIAEARIAKALTDQGIAVLRFDFTGLGESGGEFSDTNFTTNLQDIIQAAHYLQSTYSAPALLIGHSLGGTAVLAAASEIRSIKAVASIAAPSDPAHIIHHFEKQLPQIIQKGYADVNLGGRPFLIKKQFIDDIQQYGLLKQIPTLRVPVLIFHSPVDEIVDISHARHIYEALKHPKSFISLDKANHLLTNRKDATYVAHVLAAWASRYVDTEVDQSVKQTDVNLVTVAETRYGKFQQHVRSRQHHLYADELEDMGGLDSGLSPYEFLLAGLGACTSMTLRMYADHKGIPLSQVFVTLNHEKIYTKDCEDCDKSIKKLDKITRNIQLQGNLSVDQRNRLVEIANRCPVHNTLVSSVKIETTLK